MAIIQGPCDSFLKEAWQAIHDIEDDTIKIALYGSSASLGPETTAYTTTGEIVVSGYTAGGATLSGKTLTVANGILYADFSDVSWSGAFSAVQGALIYNSSKSNRAIWVLNFGLARSSTTTFTVRFPEPLNDRAIFRLRAR